MIPIPTTAAPWQPPHPRRGLARVDLIAVCLVLTVAAALAAPTLTRVREDGQAVTCAGHLGAISQALGMLEQDYPGYYAPLWDEDANKVGHHTVAATWIDVLQEHGYLASRAPGYCPADQLPDPLNEMRGAAWGFSYPAALGGGPGMDHSYAVSIPYSSHADPAVFPCWDPNGDPDRRVIVTDGLWSWTNNLGGQAVVQRPYGDYATPYWGSNTTAYRHKYGANLLHRDGHVQLVAYDRDPEDLAPSCGEISGVDTTKHFIWRPGEHVEVGVFSPFNTCNDPPPGCTAYPAGDDALPDTLEPQWYSENDAWTIPDIYEYKGWDPPQS